MTIEAGNWQLPQDTTCDAFLGGRLYVRQPARGYRAGFDAIMLAASVEEQRGHGFCLADLGAGAGVVGLAIATRVPEATVTLVENNPLLVALAEANARSNGLAARVSVVIADVTAPHGELCRRGLEREHFDHIVMNPPYYVEGNSDRSPDAIKGGAHQMSDGDLERWIRTAVTLCRAYGSLTIVHRADAIGEILAAIEGRFGAARILPLHSTPNAPAHRVLVRAVKGRRSRPTLLPGRVVHEPDGSFAPWAEAILRKGEGLEL